MLALVTAASAIDLDTDLPLLVAELPEARVVIWDDPDVEWARFDVAVIRSTWDYHERRAEFVDWARRTDAVTNLWNPVDLLVWNTDKRYLTELADAGIATVPTWFVSPGEPTPGDVPLDVDVVVKPSVGAGSNGVVRSWGRRDDAVAHVHALHARGLTAMIQPYLADVDRLDETGLVYLGGEFSHAFGKQPILRTPDPAFSGPFADEVVFPRRPTPAERMLGDRVADFLPPTAYARVDLLPTPDGPAVLEVEVTEPSLFLECGEGSASRAAAAFRSLAR